MREGRVGDVSLSAVQVHDAIMAVALEEFLKLLELLLVVAGAVVNLHALQRLVVDDAVLVQLTGDVAGDNLTGPVNANLGSVIDSDQAATLNIPLPISVATGEYVHITGSSSVSYFDDSAQPGTERTLVFNSSLTLLHDAYYMILPGNTDIVTQPGDVGIFRSEGGGKWRCTCYTPSSGDNVNDLKLVHLAGTETISGDKTFERPIISTVASGTAPLTVASTDLVSNLNSEFLNGEPASYYLNASNINSGTLNSSVIPLFIGDVTNKNKDNNLLTLELATVNEQVGSFGSNNQIGSFSVNAKGLVTYAENIEILPTNIGAVRITGDNLIGPVNANMGISLTPDNNGLVNIGSASGEYMHISGTGNINSFDAIQAGTERTIIFDTTLTLIYNSTSLILPGQTNIDTQPGDSAIFRSEDNGIWRCISYSTASGSSISNSIYVHIDGDEDILGNKTFAAPITSTVQYGTAPLIINSATMVNNLNAEFFNGELSTFYAINADVVQLEQSTQTITGAITISDTLSVGGNYMYFSGFIEPNNNVTKPATPGLITIDQDLKVSGTLNVDQTITATHDISGFTLNASENINCGKLLTVGASSTFYGAVSMQSTASVSTNLTVGGILTLNGNIVVNSSKLVNNLNAEQLNSQPSSYYATDTLVVHKSGDTLSGPVNANMGSTITAIDGSTLAIGAATGEYIHVGGSGIINITTFDTIQAGTERTIIFDTAIIIHNDITKIILPGGQNIIAQQGDTAIFRSEGSGLWRCITYGTVSGSSLADSSYVHINFNEEIVGSKTFQQPITSLVATGTPALVINSTDLIQNLNTELLNGQSSSYYLTPSNLALNTLQVTGDVFNINFGVSRPSTTSSLQLELNKVVDLGLDGNGNPILTGVYGDQTRTLTLNINNKGLITGIETNLILPLGIGAVPLTGANLTGPINDSSDSITSSNNIDIVNTYGAYIHITGTTDIYSFTTAQKGTERTLVFDGSLTITASDTLILPGNTDIVTQPGDVGIFRSEGGGKWRCIYFSPADLSYFNSLFVHVSNSETITGQKTFTAPIISTVTTGTSPLTIASTTLVSNLNTELLNGHPSSYYLDLSNFSVSPSQLKNLATGTADNTTYLRGDGVWSRIPLGLPSIFSQNMLSDGTINVTLNAQNSNTIFVGPATTGTNGTPSFRLLDVTDINEATTINGMSYLATSLLGSATADNTTFLRGDNAWSSITLLMPDILGISTTKIPQSSATITTGGNFNVTLTSQPHNTIFAGPILNSKGDTTPIFRNLDILDINTASSEGANLISTSLLGTGTADSTTYLRGDGIWSAGGIEISLTMPSSVFTVSGSPVTTGGTLGVVLANQPLNTFFASPPSSNIGSTIGTPSFRFLDVADINLATTSNGALYLSTSLLGQGSPDSTNYLRGDGTWHTLSGGTVSSVSVSLPSSVFTVSNPTITTSGTIGFTFNSQSQSLFFASPAGNSGTPSFRALYLSDIPLLDAAHISTGIINPNRLGSNNTATSFLRGDNTWVSINTGDVSSVSLYVPSDVFTITNPTITSSGTITVGYQTQTQNLFFASPVGSTNIPSFRKLDISDINSITTGTILPGLLGTGTPSNTTYLIGDGSWQPLSTPESANTIYSGPTNGSAALPTFRSLVNADLPASGITAGTYPKVTVNAQGIVTGSSTLVNSDLPTSGVTAGTYNKVTVNSQGIVTGSSTLTASDINSALSYTIANDSLVVHLANTETITGNKTFNGSLIIPTMTSTDNSQNAASTAYVTTAISAFQALSFIYKGTINITSTPPASPYSGWMYQVSTGGTPNNGYSWAYSTTIVDQGDFIFYNGSKWNRFANTNTAVTAGTGITIVATGDTSYAVSISNQIGAASNVGTASSVPVLTYNAQGQLTSVTTTNIAINDSAVTYSPKPVNTVFAGPSSGGSSATPTFRSLVNADLPASGITAGTYPKVTVNAQGIVTGSVALTASDINTALTYTAANDSSVVHQANLETITGSKIFNAGITMNSTTMTMNSSTISMGGNTITNPQLTSYNLTMFDNGIVSSGTATLNLSKGNYQKIQINGSITLAFSNWAASGIYNELMIEMINGGSQTITWPAINFITGTGTFQSTPTRSLQNAGTDWIAIWTHDNGTTLYGKVI